MKIQKWCLSTKFLSFVSVHYNWTIAIPAFIRNGHYISRSLHQLYVIRKNDNAIVIV